MIIMQPPPPPLLLLHTLLLSLILLRMTVHSVPVASVPPTKTNFCELFEVEGGGVSEKMVCNGLDDLAISLSQIPSNSVRKIGWIEISQSDVPILSLDLLAQKLPSLLSLSVTFSNVSVLEGVLPLGLRHLNLSWNSIKVVEASIFPNSSDTLKSREESRFHNSSSTPTPPPPQHGLVVIDLSHNKIVELPSCIFHLQDLEFLRLAGNQLKYDFVWDKLWEWKIGMGRTLEDENTTYCRVHEEVGIFHYTVQVVLAARKELEATCSSVNASLCSCGLYALPKIEGSEGISISLKLDCSSRNLTQLPTIPPQTWQLNLSHNAIKDLSPLKMEECYGALLNLDISWNRVELESLAGSPFIHKYSYLNLQNNQFKSIPTYILNSLKSTTGQGFTFLGGNNLDCDCNTVTEIKPLLIENSKRIMDIKDIVCRKDNMRLIELTISDLCVLHEASSSSFELYLYLLIVLEALIIILIIAKVWHDQRTFRRTGRLPWFSAKMPRLPCDAMLENVKETTRLQPHPPSGGGGGMNGSIASSNVNVAAPMQLTSLEGSSVASANSSGAVTAKSIQAQGSRGSQGSVSTSV